MQFWVPTSMQERFDASGYKLEDRGARWIEGFAKLRPGATREQAQEEIAAVAKRLEAAYPETDRGRGVELLPLWRTPFNKASELLPTLGITLAVVSLVLLIACANVSNLLLVRSLARPLHAGDRVGLYGVMSYAVSQRRRELGLRLALGASAADLLRLVMSYGLVLTGGGVVLGVAVALATTRLLGYILYQVSPRDPLAFGAAFVVMAITSLAACLVPAWRAPRIDPVQALRD